MVLSFCSISSNIRLSSELFLALSKIKFNIKGKDYLKKKILDTSLVVQWLRLCFQCRWHGFDPWLGSSTCHAERQKKKS